MTITQKVALRASPKEVYRIYQTSKLHSAATGAPAKIQARVGGKMTAWDGYIRGRFLHLVRDRLIVQSWRASDWVRADADSVLVLELEETPSGCRVIMTQAGVPAGTAAALRSGWTTFYWTPLRRFLAEQRRTRKTG